MSKFQLNLKETRLLQKVDKPRSWLITGAAGFIGSNLVETLLLNNQNVIGIDNYSFGKVENLQELAKTVGADAWSKFRFIEGDITDCYVCADAVDGVDFVLHQAAIGSVPRSIAQPAPYIQSNIVGFVNIVQAAMQANVRRFIYASSSSVYGDTPELPKVEGRIGFPLSPYALTKSVNEQYAKMVATVYGFPSIGLRYFNVFGKRQDPHGAYAAVIPKWIALLLQGSPCLINGDGETSRDFCYVANVVQANIKAALTEDPAALNQVYNVAVGEQTTLNQLFYAIRDELSVVHPMNPSLATAEPIYRDFRKGDIRHSLADISKVCQLLGYEPTHNVEAGLHEAIRWYIQRASREEDLQLA
ncbi:MAG: SDR family oxidoreductase [Chloroflexota bacterium]